MAAFLLAFMVDCCMSETLTKFWSKLPPDHGKLHIHPDDLDWFRENKWDVQDQPLLTFDKFIRSNRFREDDKQLHLSLLPVPFVGNLEKAKVFILLMNPGLGASNYYEEEDAAFRAACISNISQTNGNDEFPFFCLNPRFAWSGGFIWWEARLRPILSKLVAKSGCTYYEALASLAKQIVAVELIPYHSVDGSALNGRGNPWKNLPSARHAREFVKRLCGAKEKPLVVVLRSHERWGLDEHIDCTCEKCPAIRRPTLNPKLTGKSGAAGRLIMKKLRIS
ncbi:MAG: hypothetical protein BGO25_12685 [Acidobacteriales bacterium 59-55]|nr:MAG: hypothetical protein BGO25_12685 [Acidobacteriales bacterium 59-55]